MGKKIRKQSLKGLLIKMVLFCWVLPLLCIIIVMGFFSSREIYKQILSGVKENTKHAARICARQLDSAVNASYEATFNSDILYTAYHAFQEGASDVRGNKDKLFANVTGYLKSQYRYDTRFDMALMSYVCWPNTIYYTYDSSRGTTFSQFTEYHKRVHAKIMDYAKNLGTHVGFYLDDKTENVFLVRNLVDASTFKPYAVLILQLNKVNFFEHLTNIAYSNNVLIKLGNTKIQLKGNENLKTVDGSPNIIQQPSIYYFSGTESFGSYKLKYAVKLDSTLLSKTLSYTINIVLLLILLVIPLLFISIRFFYYNITHPIEILENGLRKLGKGELGVHVEQNFSSNEFSYLAVSFNHMSEKLSRQFQQIYSDELALRDAKIMALQSQINPHFLNNSLEIINWEARMNDDDKVSKMISALSTMIDAAMDRSHMPEIELYQEMEYVDAYLFMLEQRFDRKLIVKKEIDETLLNYLVPRLVMQPILENAVEHGVKQQKNDRQIILRISKRNNTLYLDVENTGKLSEEDKHKIDQLLSDNYDVSKEGSTNLGIRNVHQRLRILYGSESGLCIFGTEHETTIARLSLPLHDKAFVLENIEQ